MSVKIAFIDLETTGVNFWQHGIHQISVAIEIDGEIKERFNFKVAPNPSAKIEADALEVGNVTEEQIKAYPPMKEVYKLFVAMLAKYCDKFDKTDKFFLCGFNNASFDNQFLRAWFVQNANTEKEAKFGNYFGSWFWSNSLDVMVLAAEKLKHMRAGMVDFKLKTVAKEMGIEIDESKLHDAAYDINLTMQIYKLITQ